MFPGRDKATTEAIARKYKELCDRFQIPNASRLSSEQIAFNSTKLLISRVLKLLKEKGGQQRTSRPTKWWNGQKASPLAEYYVPAIMNHCDTVAGIMSDKCITTSILATYDSDKIETIKDDFFEYWRIEVEYMYIFYHFDILSTCKSGLSEVYLTQLNNVAKQ